jgi:hypothetical protein
MYSTFVMVGNPNDAWFEDGIYAGGVVAIYHYQWVAVPEEDTTIPMNVVVAEATNNIAGTSYFPNLVGNSGDLIVDISEPVVVDRSINYYTKALFNTNSGTPADSITIDVPTTSQYFWLYFGVDTPEGGTWGTFRALIDYDDNLVTAATMTGATWNQGLTAIIKAMIQGGDLSSDNFSSHNGTAAWTPSQENPAWEMGNYYTQIAPVVDSVTTQGHYLGVTVNGYVTRVRYNFKTVPTMADCQQDENGYYISFPITIVDSFYSLDGTNFVSHDEINTSAAKIYINFPTPVETYTVTFVDGLTNETITVMENVEAGTAVTYPEAPAHEGYTFVGWNPAAIESLEGDTTVVANYEVNKYTVTYNINGEYYTEQEYDFGAAVTAPAFTAPTGYTFSGWNVPETMPAEDITLDATLTPINYTITINYYRWSDALEMWVAAQSQKTITIAYGSIYDVNAQIPETIGEYVLDHIDGDTTGTVTGNITIDAYYVVPYEPVAPVIASNAVELRNRATEDGKKDVRFIFTVVFNDANVNYNGNMEGADPAYFEITALGATVTAGKTVTMAAKNIYEMGDDSFTFTIVISGIQEKNWGTTIQAVPYMTYVPVDGEAVTVYGDAIETTVNDIIAAD